MDWLYCAGSAPCRDGGRLPLREPAPLDGAKYSELATLRRSSLGECTDAASGHELTPVSGRCCPASACPNPKLEKPVLRASIWRDEVKFEEVGSRSGFAGFEREPWPVMDVLETGKYDEGELSEYCCDGWACAMERFRAGETPELLTWGMVPDVLSPHAGRVGRHSVSESATREPEPVLPSGTSAEAPASVLFSVRVSVGC